MREWFCDEMGKLGVPEQYVDAFCGRVPKSVLARRYNDFCMHALNLLYTSFTFMLKECKYLQCMHV